MKKSGDLGVRLVGGNAVGIFIHSVEVESVAYGVGLRSADQILEYGRVDLRQSTAEQAAYELAKPADKVVMLVQFNPDKYNRIKDQPGDSYFVRTMFSRLPDYNDPQQLAFNKDDILYVDNTMYNGVPGHWSAWIVDADGNRGAWGVIPSKYKVEEELLMKRCLTFGATGVDAQLATPNMESGDHEEVHMVMGPPSMTINSSRKSWTNARRSFFKRRKGGRSSSRDANSGANGNGGSGGGSGKDAKELASYSDVASLSSFASLDNALLAEQDNQPINSYVRVERLDYCVTRPVLIVGPLADAVLDKLLTDSPMTFAKCEMEYMNCSQEALEKGLLDNVLIDFRRRGSHFECTTVAAIKDVAERNRHCILNVHLESVERLHANQIYPIVLLIKFKSVKQIKEVKDYRYNSAAAGFGSMGSGGGGGFGSMGGGAGGTGGGFLQSGIGSSSGIGDKISQKDAKTIFEHTQKLESEYKHLISDTIHAGANLMLMCAQIESKIHQEQSKTLWIPSGTIW